MKCPFCSHFESKVIDSRPTDDNAKIRRRRECMACQKRFTSYEVIEAVPLMVIKKDGSRELFDRSKILKGLVTACYKRPISYEILEQMVFNIEKMLTETAENEVSAAKIGDIILENLKNVDEVAYIRFASVYKQFDDIDTFMNELKALIYDK